MSETEPSKSSSVSKYGELCKEVSESELLEHLPKQFTSSRSEIKRKSRIGRNEEMEVRRLFEKKFKLKEDNVEWCLPETDTMFRDDVWIIPELQAVKEELNSVKSALNDFDTEDWHRHTSAMNKSGSVLWKLKTEYEPEFVTQAWCKFYEIVMSFLLVPLKVTEVQWFNSVHLSEAPGAFIASLNHFLKLHHPCVKWDWRATTLNPYYEGNHLSSMINDDRFVFHTLPHWIFGNDYTGDITHVDNIVHLVKETDAIGEVQLVTADGSIDCQDNPAEQECVVSFLHYCETIAALFILGQGGSFLLKIFTTYEAQTVCLLYLLCCAFHQVHLFKPATSKEGNSEVYVICLEYKGRDHLKPWLEIMKNHVVSASEFKNYIMFPLESIPQNFINQLLSCSEMYKILQVETIQSNIQMYGVSSNIYNIKRFRYLTAQYFMKHYKLERLSDKSKGIVGNLKLKETVMMNLDTHTRKGSYSEMLQQKISGSKGKLSRLLEEIMNFDISSTVKCNIKWLAFQSSVIKFNMITGKPINTIYSSKFCSRHLLQIWNNVQEEAAHITDSKSLSKIEYHGHLGNSEITAEIISKDDSFISTDLKMLSIKTEYWRMFADCSNEKVEKEAFLEIMEFISKLQNGETLLLCGYPLLTQFNVGVIYLLSSLFEKVGFINPLKHRYSIMFVGFQLSNENVLRYLNNIRDVCTDLKNKGAEESVLAVVAIDTLCGKQVQNIDSCSPTPVRKQLKKEVEYLETSSDFYICVTEMNNVYVKELSSEVISHLINER